CYLNPDSLTEGGTKIGGRPRDAVGLAWAGRFFSGSQPRKWLRSATRLAVAQADEQLLADGGHFERSPMYHLDVMDDFEVLAFLLTDSDAQEAMCAARDRMSDVAVWLQHPDGRVAQLNDAERRFAASIGPRPTGGRHFAETGLIVWQGDPWCLFFDVGEIGPDYQPGHAHADTLTVECSYGGQRLFVDPGCHSYDNDERRRYDRATDSHNTVCIDGVDSSEVWHIFRVGRRARPQATFVELTSNTMHAVGSHNGYRFLSGQPNHRRTVEIDADATLRIADVIEGSGQHIVTGGYLLEPCWQAESIEDGWRLRSGSTELTIRIQGSIPLELTTESRPTHPHYGVVTESQRLCWRCEAELSLRVETEVAVKMPAPSGPLGTRRNESSKQFSI
ncbi:MAG: alginate lyase family protein, partial [Planctomycetaceae bacterium]|nr:alginate lyase family protein [Planctomycetaceae bacterium]